MGYFTSYVNVNTLHSAVRIDRRARGVVLLRLHGICLHGEGVHQRPLCSDSFLHFSKHGKEIKHIYSYPHSWVMAFQDLLLISFETVSLKLNRVMQCCRVYFGLYQ